MGRRTKELSAEEVEYFARRFALFSLNNSAGLSRRLALGERFGNVTVRQMTSNKIYCDALNAYMVRIKKPIRYELVNGILTPINKA